MLRSRARGVTLLELLVVLSLLAIAVAAATPWASGVMGELELRSGAARIASVLVRARLAAMAHGRPWRVGLVDAVTFESGPDGGAGERFALPGRVRFAGAPSGGDVRFSPAGWAENATFTLARGPRARSVVVNQRGRVAVRAGGVP